MTKAKKFLAAVAQVRPATGGRSAVEAISHFSRQAASEGASLVLFPEAYIGGYPRGSGFGSVVGQRTDEGREAFRTYWDAAIDVPGVVCDQLSEIAARDRVELIVGVIERGGGTLYCTVLFFSPEGVLRGKHRKLMPTGSERLIWGFGNGSTMPVFETAVGKVGAVICWENYMPLMRAAHYAKGIEIYCAPTADGRDSWLPTMRHIAMEGRCFVLTCNQFARASDYPEAPNPGHGEDDPIVSRGGSCIIDPFGNVLAGPDFTGEALLIAEIDRDQIARAKYDLDVTGHYSRPDVFRLTVDETDTRPVVFTAE